MYGLRMKMSGHHLHTPSRHAMAVRMSHMVHSQLFWPLVAVAILLGAVIGLIILGITTGGTPDMEWGPFLPFSY